MNTLSKGEWIAEVARLLCVSQRAENVEHYYNLCEWAEAIYEAELEAAGGHEDIEDPMTAHNYELSCA